MISSAPGEEQSLGLYKAAEFLVWSGWAVQVGSPLCHFREVVDQVAIGWFDIIGVSLACDTRFPALKREIQKLQSRSLNRAVKVMVGGRSFSDHRDMIRQVDADGFGVDARVAPAVGQGRLSPHARVVQSC